MSLPTDNKPNLPKRCGLCFQVTPLPVLFFILSAILLPFCGLFAVISGHITLRSIRTTDACQA